jgi:hypothetical protein
MDVDVQRQACLQPGSQTKSHGDQRAYSDQVLHRNPPHKTNPTLAVGKKDHVRFGVRALAADSWSGILHA